MIFFTILFFSDMAGFPEGRGNNVARNRIASPTRNGGPPAVGKNGRPNPANIFRTGWE